MHADSSWSSWKSIGLYLSVLTRLWGHEQYQRCTMYTQLQQDIWDDLYIIEMKSLLTGNEFTQVSRSSYNTMSEKLRHSKQWIQSICQILHDLKTIENVPLQLPETQIPERLPVYILNFYHLWTTTISQWLRNQLIHFIIMRIRRIISSSLSSKSLQLQRKMLKYRYIVN